MLVPCSFVQSVSQLIMDGRAVVHGKPVDDVDEEEMRERGHEEEGNGPARDGDGSDDTGREIFLSRDEFDMLQAFHCVIPLPALSSNILRVFVDEDLQVPDAPGDGGRGAAPARPEMDESDQVRSSPLTRRLSKRSSGGSARSGKPHFEIDLSSRTAKQGQARVTSFAASAIGPATETKTRK